MSPKSFRFNRISLWLMFKMKRYSIKGKQLESNVKPDANVM